ncbi:UNVERIFIED_CONTAM: ccmA [Trichonephila clavipes]
MRRPGLQCRPSDPPHTGIRPVLELQDLEAWRDDRCLFGALSLSLPAGGVVQVGGANGVGKTTLLQLVAGLAPLSRGRVCWRGRDRDHDPAAFLRELLFLGHLPGIKAALTVAENLRFLAAARGLAPDDAAIAAALARVRLDGHEDSLAGHLSAGQKRRVALARLFTEPVPLWLLDEPFTAIDREGVAGLEGWIADHAEAGGLVMLTTHHALALRCPLQQLQLLPAYDDDADGDDACADGAPT